MHEMKGFLACVLNMGIIKKPAIASYWATHCSQATSWFWKMFIKHCSSHLLRFFHLVNNEELPGLREPDFDPCARYQHLVDHAKRVLRHQHIPLQEINVNNSLVGTRNKTSLLQYLPNRLLCHWGIRF
jgi:hypothetical protein